MKKQHHVEAKIYRLIDKSPLCSKKNLVGYCWSLSHPGFISKRLLKEHQCVEKNCRNLERFEHAYWAQLERQKCERENVKAKKKNQISGKKILSIFRDLTKDVEEFAATSIFKEGSYYVIQYATLHMVDLSVQLWELKNMTGVNVKLKAIKAPYAKRKLIIEKVLSEKH